MTTNVWRERRVAAWLLGVAVALTPAVAAVASGWGALEAVGRPPDRSAMVAAVVVAAGVTLTAHTAATRALRSLLPLQALLAVSVVFPDRAPSRVAVALRANRAHRLARRLAQSDGPATVAEHGDPPAGVAAELLAVLGRLGRHDPRTRGHAERVRAYTETIARRLGLHAGEVVLLGWAALLHDIGKIGVPRDILNKPGRLTPDEDIVMRQHPEMGDRLVARLRTWLGPYADVPLRHHERWDGGGYPGGLAGEGIPLGARIVAVADAFDVMTSARSYKGAGPRVDARAELVAAAGTQFDPDVVRAFLLSGIEPIPGRRSAAASAAGWLGALRWSSLTGEGLSAAGSALGTAIGTAGLLGAAAGMLVLPDLGAPASAAPASVAAVTPALPAAGAAVEQAPGRRGETTVTADVISLLDTPRDPLITVAPPAPAPGPPAGSPRASTVIGAGNRPAVDGAVAPVALLVDGVVAPVVDGVMAPVVDGLAAPVAPLVDGGTSAVQSLVDGGTAVVAPTLSAAEPLVDPIQVAASTLASATLDAPGPAVDALPAAAPVLAAEPVAAVVAGSAVEPLATEAPAPAVDPVAVTEALPAATPLATAASGLVGGG